MNSKILIFALCLFQVFTQKLLTDAKPVIIGQGAVKQTSNKAADGLITKSKTGFYNVTDENHTIGLEAKVHFGTYGVSGENSNGTEIYNVEVLTTEVAVGTGLMGRIGIVDANVKAGPVGINVGVAVDTGLLVKDGLEVKLLGVGGSITKKGFQVCVVLCFGIKWQW